MKWLMGLASTPQAAGVLRTRLGALAKLAVVPVILTLPLLWSSAASAQWYDFDDDYGANIYDDDLDDDDGDYGVENDDEYDADDGDDIGYVYSGYGYGGDGLGVYDSDSYYTPTWFDDDDEFYDWYD